jgi:fluoroquinolone resistance protein
MSKTYIEEKTFKGEDYSEAEFPKGDYENCTFNGCNFSGTDLSEVVFSECEFIACNMSIAKMAKTALRDVKFKDCKMLGLHFENCSEFLFAVDFEKCILNFSCFYKRNLKKTKFRNSTLQEADFTEADLTGALFDSSDLGLAVFDNTVLEKADLRTAYNYAIDPDSNRIKKAKFSMSGIAGLLHKYDIEID